MLKGWIDAEFPECWDYPSILIVLIPFILAIGSRNEGLSQEINPGAGIAWSV
jgi:hypothetical protein